MWETLIFKWFLLLKIQINSKNRFWKEKSVEDVATLGQTAQATLVIHNIPFFSDATDLGIVGKSSHHLVSLGWIGLHAGYIWPPSYQSFLRKTLL
jgi:hypothetical protein